MGREVRRVPATWEHPKDYKGHYIPLYDRSYTAACKEWKEGYAAWESGEDSSRAKNPDVEYWDWNGMPPDKDTHCPEWTDAERTHYQMYETVSEGTPVSPVFATPKELARYLSDNGDFWYQMGGAYRMPNASYEGWLRVCNGGYAPSMVIHNGVLSSGVEALTQQGE